MIFVITCHCIDFFCTLSALRNQSTANICRPYSSSNKEYIVTIIMRALEGMPGIKVGGYNMNNI